MDRQVVQVITCTKWFSNFVQVITCTDFELLKSLSLHSHVRDLRFATAIRDFRFSVSLLFQRKCSHVCDLRLRFAAVSYDCDFLHSFHALEFIAEF